MIVKYRGEHCDWILEEADVITYKVISIRDIRHTLVDSEMYKNATSSTEAYKILKEYIKDYIREEAEASEEITFRGLIDLEDGDKFIIVLLDDNRTRVFSYGTEVYILNNSGKTIQKL